MTICVETAWAALRHAAGRGPAPAVDALHASNAAALDGPARDLVDCLGPVAQAGARLAIGQIGQSLDGRICTESGDSHYVNGDAALTHLHRLRALVDCVLVGVGTVVTDRPRLTVRRVRGEQPLRAVLDPAGRAPPDVSPLAAGDDEPPTLHLVGRTALAGLPPAAAHVRRLPVAIGDDRVAPAAVLDALAGIGCSRVLIEGGATTLSGFVAADALDRLHVLVAPLLIGSGRPGLVLPPVTKLADARRPVMHTRKLDDDVLFDVELG
jgi:riboflavin-specific deaminase-like protein